ncbi:MAG: hypothetical protein KDD48_02055 [Bdellovibrionales bacterium]|nr:hypothetical protein [Bdellovibrionales bacterium]
MNCEPLNELKHSFLTCLSELPIERLVSDKKLIDNIYSIDKEFNQIQKRKELK